MYQYYPYVYPNCKYSMSYEGWIKLDSAVDYFKLGWFEVTIVCSKVINKIPVN